MSSTKKTSCNLSNYMIDSLAKRAWEVFLFLKKKLVTDKLSLGRSGNWNQRKFLQAGRTDSPRNRYQREVFNNENLYHPKVFIRGKSSTAGKSITRKSLSEWNLYHREKSITVKALSESNRNVSVAGKFLLLMS